MQALRGLAWLLAFQSAGELLARGLSLPFPGPVVGMVLLLLALRWQVVQAPVASCADFLLAHLSLLFVPVGVGVMTHLFAGKPVRPTYVGGGGVVNPGRIVRDRAEPASTTGPHLDRCSQRTREGLPCLTLCSCGSIFQQRRCLA